MGVKTMRKKEHGSLNELAASANRYKYLMSAIIRIWLSMIVGIWFPADQTYDDALMILYADLKAYFINGDQREIMLKELGMPLVLQITKILKIPYPALIGILWILAAAIGALIIRKLAKSEKLAFFIYLFILFQPSAFESWCGTRFYRAGLLNPLYFITILLAVFIALEYESHAGIGKISLLSIGLGLVFSLTYYIKEDGPWLLMTLLFIMAFWWINAIRNKAFFFQKKGRLKSLAALLMPLLLFGLVSLGYRFINYHYFGVFETNMRTSGQPMRFVQNVYRIDAKGKTDRIWASKDAIEKAFEASPTLKNAPELKDAVLHTNWQGGDIGENPMEGDRLTWVMKDAVMDTGMAENQAQKQDFFRKVNRELEEAFKSGSLQKDHKRIFLFSSIGGISKRGLFRGVGDGADLFRRHVLLDGYVPGASIFNYPQLQDLCEKASIFSNFQLTAYTSETGLDYMQSEKDFANRIISVIFTVYRILIPTALGSATIGLFAKVRRVFLNRKSKNNPAEAGGWCHILKALGFLGIAGMYCYIIAVFCFTFAEEAVSAEIMYSAGLPSILTAYIILGICMLPFFTPHVPAEGQTD